MTMTDTKAERDQKAGDDAGGRLSMFIEGAPFAVAMFDREMRYLAWSRLWAHRHGAAERDLAGLCHYDHFPDLPEQFVDAHRGALAGKSISVEYAPIVVEGQVYWERWRIEPIRDAGKDVIGIAVFTEDITREKEAEARLRESETRLRLVIEALGIGIVEKDYRTGKETFSRTFQKMAGLTGDDPPNDLEGWIALLCPAQRDRFQDARRRALDVEGDGVFRADMNLEVNGEKREMQLVGRVLFEGEGDQRTPSRFVGILIDQTERTELQESLARSRRLETIGRIAGIIAHDFNNLLSAILANLELAAMRVTDDQASEHLKVAMNAAEMGGDFNKKLLALSGGQDVQPAHISLDEQILKTWAMFERLLNEDIALRFVPGADDFCVRIDPAELDGAMLNLVVNARDAQPQGGEITIATRTVEFDDEAAKAYADGKPGHFLELSVCDKGVGMTESEVLRAKEPFFSSKAAAMGSGLGLTSVAASIARVEGFVAIESRKGEGTRVSLFIPVAEGIADRHVPQEEIPFGDGELVLVVEDDALVREATLKRLEALGYAVIEAGDGRTALTLLAEGEPVDLVFSDVVLPGEISGYDIADQVRRHDRDCAVLLTSGHLSRKKPPAGAGPMPELLKKPYSLAVLAQAMERALKYPPSPAQHPR